jgi:hypothetical protein
MSAAGDRDFDALVRGIETDYGVSRTRIPLMGMVNFFVKVSRPGGGRELRLALFETPRLNSLDTDLENRLAPGWRPFVRVISKGREATAIYANPTGKHFKLLIATLESHEATLVQVSLSQKALKQWLTDPVGRVKH